MLVFSYPYFQYNFNLPNCWLKLFHGVYFFTKSFLFCIILFSHMVFISVFWNVLDHFDCYFHHLFNYIFCDPTKNCFDLLPNLFTFQVIRMCGLYNFPSPSPGIGFVESGGLRRHFVALPCIFLLFLSVYLFCSVMMFLEACIIKT